MISEEIKNKMVEMGYSGDFSLKELFLYSGARTLFKRDDGTYGCAGGYIFVGYVSGVRSLEEACALFWIRTRQFVATDAAKRKKRNTKRK